MRRFIACFALLLASTARAQDTVVVVVRHIPATQDTGVVVRHINPDSGSATTRSAPPRRFAPPAGPPYGTRFPARPNEFVYAKDPGAAQGLSFLFPGGGQYYAGAPEKGVIITLLAIGAPIVGYANVRTIREQFYPPCLPGANPCGPYYQTRGRDWTPAAIGLAVGIGSWFYGIATAGHDALKWNKDHKVQFIEGPGRAGFAVRVP